MKRSYMTMALVAATFTETSAFAPACVGQGHRLHSTSLKVSAVAGPDGNPVETEPFHGQPLPSTNDSSTPTLSDTPTVKKLKPKPAPKHNDGILSPVVLLAKDVLGDENLNKIRAKAISLHSDVIASFVDMADTPLGSAALKTLFKLADANHNGKIEEEELAKALRTLGFDWLKEKQVHGIFERADLDHNGMIDVDEWLREAPKTLRTNLIKLAKKNGGELGLLV